MALSERIVNGEIPKFKIFCYAVLAFLLRYVPMYVALKIQSSEDTIVPSSIPIHTKFS